MIALKILGVVAGWILCGVLVYTLMKWYIGTEKTDEEKAWRLSMSILFAPGLFVVVVLAGIVFGVFKICLLVVKHKNNRLRADGKGDKK